MNLITIFLFIKRSNLNIVSKVRMLQSNLLTRRSMKKSRSSRIKRKRKKMKNRVVRKVSQILSSK